MAAGCCDDRALRLVEVEGAAVGTTLASHAIDDLAGMAAAEIHPTGDIYASALYRRRALEELLRRTLRELLLIA